MTTTLGVIKEPSPPAYPAPITEGPPTAEEIGAIFDWLIEKWPASNHVRKVHDAVDEAFNIIAYLRDPTFDEDDPELGNYVWTDLRPTEDAKLSLITTEAIERTTQRVLDVIRQGVIDAGLRFAAECPTATRQTRDPNG